MLGSVAILATGCGPDRHDMPESTALVALGQQLFADQVLSSDGKVACATCHQPERAYTDGRPHAVGVNGRTGTRNAPSLVDVGRQHTLFWDRRRTRLEEQALDPLLNEAEHGLANEAQLLERQRAAPHYRTAFAEAFTEDGAAREPVTTQHVAAATAAFERTLLGREVLLDPQLAELGRFAVTLDPHDLAAFKTPGLRNVARTGPYMHDGSVATLGRAVDLEVYSRGARDARPMILTPSERSDVIAFLEALNGDRAEPSARSE
jgi:cytochrome c peroxidase